MIKYNYPSSENFDSYDNKYTIIKEGNKLKIAYGHFYNNQNMFVCLKLHGKTLHKNTNDDYYRIDTSNILLDDYNHFYLFNSLDVAKLTKNIITEINGGQVNTDSM